MFRSIAVQTMTSLTGVNVIQYYQSEFWRVPEFELLEC